MESVVEAYGFIQAAGVLGLSLLIIAGLLSGLIVPRYVISDKNKQIDDLRDALRLQQETNRLSTAVTRSAVSVAERAPQLPAQSDIVSIPTDIWESIQRDIAAIKSQGSRGQG